jgi:hypothetical protein
MKDLKEDRLLFEVFPLRAEAKSFSGQGSICVKE